MMAKKKASKKKGDRKKASRKKPTQKKAARKQSARPARRATSTSARKRKSGSDEDVVYTDVRRAMHSAILRRLR